MVVPLVFFSLVSGIASLSSLKSFGNIASKTIALYLLTTAIAVSISLIVGSIFQPGSGYLIAETAALKDLPEGQGIYQTIVNIVPANIIDAMAKNQMLAIVFFKGHYHVHFRGTTLKGSFSNANKYFNLILKDFET